MVKSYCYLGDSTNVNEEIELPLLARSDQSPFQKADIQRAGSGALRTFISKRPCNAELAFSATRHPIWIAVNIVLGWVKIQLHPCKERFYKVVRSSGEHHVVRQCL